MFSILLLIITSRHKQVIKKIQDGKKSPEMSPGYMCPLSDTWWFLPAGEALRERIGKKKSLYLLFDTIEIPYHRHLHPNFTSLVYDYTRFDVK